MERERRVGKKFVECFSEISVTGVAGEGGVKTWNLQVDCGLRFAANIENEASEEEINWRRAALLKYGLPPSPPNFCLWITTWPASTVDGRTVLQLLISSVPAE